MQAVSPKHVLRTERGKAFQIDLDPGYCFGMCLDVAKILLQLQSYDRPTWLPAATDLSPATWDVVRANYDGLDQGGNKRLIKACGLAVEAQTPLKGFEGHFLELVYSVIDTQGTSIFSLVGHGGSHELVWHRDDKNGIWLFFDPYSGMWQFDSMVGIAPNLAAELVSRYDDLGQKFRISTLGLKRATK